MVDRFAGGGALAIDAELVERLGAVILLPEGVTILGAVEDRVRLPVELWANAVVVDFSGTAIEGVIETV
jgi:hypothetical protein